MVTALLVLVRLQTEVPWVVACLLVALVVLLPTLCIVSFPRLFLAYLPALGSIVDYSLHPHQGEPGLGVTLPLCFPL